MYNNLTKLESKTRRIFFVNGRISFKNFDWPSGGLVLKTRAFMSLSLYVKLVLKKDHLVFQNLKFLKNYELSRDTSFLLEGRATTDRDKLSGFGLVMQPIFPAIIKGCSVNKN